MLFLCFFPYVDDIKCQIGRKVNQMSDKKKWLLVLDYSRVEVGERLVIDYFEKFLKLWKDANPSIAEVEDAKKKLAEVKSK